MAKIRTAERNQKRKYWEAHLKSWESSGISQSAYCRQHQLRLNCFIYWKKLRSSRESGVSLLESPVSRPDLPSTPTSRN